MPPPIFSRPFKMRVVTVVLGAALLAGLGIWSEVNTWQRLVQSANNRLLETSRAIALHTDDVFALAEQPLAQMTMKAEAALREAKDADRLLNDMQSQKHASAFLQSLIQIDTNGRVVRSTAASMPPGTDASALDYFSFHRSNPSHDTHIGMLVRAPDNDGWFLPVSRRIEGPDNSFAGVMVATIDLDHFVRFIESFDLGGDTTFYLMRSDGGILLRYPFRAGLLEAGLSDKEFYRNQSQIIQQGNYEYFSAPTQRIRLSGYYRSAETGVTAIATRSKTALFHFWVTRSKYPWACLIGAYILSLAIAFRWLHQIRLREIGDREVAAREAEFRLIANASPDVIERISMTGRRAYVSPAAQNLFEQSPETLVGTNVTEAEDEATSTAWKSALFRLQSGATGETILVQRTRSDGSVLWLESVLSRVRGEDAPSSDSIVVMTRDVTRQETAKRELDTLAVTDELTGLFNKRYFSQHLNGLLAERPGSPVSLLLVDLDRFKQFNDTYGHLPGDHCLRDVAAAIRAALPDKNTIAARFGGEEMAVLLPGYGKAASILLAEKLRRSVEGLQIPHAANRPFGVVTISIGLGSISGGHGKTAEALIISADQALYHAKNQGRNRVATSDAVPEDIRSAATG